MNELIKCYKHFKTITRHKYEVMKACFKIGLYWQGITHDLSKYGLSEFISSAKYFQGNSSPIDAEKSAKGYSFAWLHHIGRNPHHWEYWIDNLAKGGEPTKIPYKYCMEYICDLIGAGKIYKKENKIWTKEEPEKFFKSKLNKKEIILHPQIQEFLIVVFEAFSDIGYKALNKKTTKQLYENIIN